MLRLEPRALCGWGKQPPTGIYSLPIFILKSDLFWLAIQLGQTDEVFFFINNVKEKYFVLRILGGLERVGKGTGYPSQGPEFKSQQPCSGPQSSIMRSDTLFLQAHKQMEQLYT